MRIRQKSYRQIVRRRQHSTTVQSAYQRSPSHHRRHVNPAQQSSPEATTAAWMGAVANRDANALRDLLTDDYELWANGAPPVIGPDAAVQAMHRTISKFRIEQSFE